MKLVYSSWWALLHLVPLPRRAFGRQRLGEPDVDFTLDMGTSRAKAFTAQDKTIDSLSPAMGFRCAAIPLAKVLGLDPGAAIPPAQITGFGPRFEDGIEEHVHHMDAFACKGDVFTDYTGTDLCGDPFDVPECGPFIAVYDKGAGDYRYPDEVGMAIGEGTGTTWILLQTHYLMTGGKKDLSTLSSIGNSGFKLWLQVDGTQRANNARFLAIMDTTMDVHADAVEHEYTVTEQPLASSIQHDVEMFGAVTVFAGHLHAHDNCAGFYLDVRRQDQDANDEWTAWDEFGKIAPYGGYGSDQTMHNFGPTSDVGKRIELKGKEELRVKCSWHTPHTRLPYGTNNGDEMCGPVLLYYPTDATVTQNSVAYWGPSGRVARVQSEAATNVA